MKTSLLCLKISAALFLVVQTATVAQATDDNWSDDAANSVKLAQSEGKDLLMLFTGSDWCAPCMQLEQNVLGNESFQDGALENFVLVKFDYPQSIEQSDELKKQNAEWADRLGVSSYPTLAMLDPQLRPYAFTGFREDNASDYLAHLKKLQEIRVQRDDFMEQAESAKGAERAKLLDQALSVMTIEIAEVYYESVIEEIVSLDKDDAIGLRTKYYASKDKERRKQLMTDIAIATRLRKPEDAIEFIDATLAENELPAELKLQALGFKLQMLRRLQRFDDAINLLDEMIAIPELTPTGIQRLIVKKVYLLVGSGNRDGAIKMLDREIKQRADNLLLVVAKGELLDSMGDFKGAIDAYDQSMTAASSQSDLLIELVGAKADALYELKKQQEAIAELDKFVANQSMPADLRAEALLQKAMILREMDQKTAALRAESKALETVETPDEKAQIQKLIDHIREKINASQD